jgi:chemotaxis protein histidine kinase CheA
MPKKRVKPKSKSKKKLKTKTKSLKTKSKRKAKRVKVKVKPKTKAKKTKSKSKPKSKAKSKSRAKPKKKLKAKASAKIKFTKIQKTNLIELIKKIVDLRKKTDEGLRTLDAIDHILDQYNQKYTTAPEKFDAIISYAVIEHAKYVSSMGYIAFKDVGKDSIALYALLSDIGKGKVQYSKATDKMNSIYQEAIKK